MKIWYSAVGDTGTLAQDKPKWLPVLLSYFYESKKLKIPEVASELFLDSGAFSAKSRGMPLTVDEYCKFIHEHGSKFTTIAALDVIGNADASWDNYLAMVSNGINPMPTYHIGSDIKHLHRYAEKTDYIALGGIAKVTAKPRFQFLNQVFDSYPNPEEIGFHGFGLTQVSMMLDFPWRTVDSSTAMVAAFNGEVMSPSGRLVISDAASKNKINKSPAMIATVRSWVEGLGYNWDVAIQANTAGSIERFKVSAEYLESIKDTGVTRFTKTHQLLI